MLMAASFNENKVFLWFKVFSWFIIYFAYSSSYVVSYSESNQRSKMKLFAKIANGWKLLTIYPKSLVLDFWQDSEYASDMYFLMSLRDISVTTNSV